jgi:outer membrane receptor protein involved in Fe transport
MKFILKALLFLFLLPNFALFAQNKGNISGSVKDDVSGSPLEADIRLFTNDTVFVKGAKCDTLGAFKIENLDYGTYRLEVSNMEYSAISLKGIVLSASNPSKQFDTLKLKKQNVTTDEILVEEKKDLMTMSGDKKVFDVAQSMVTKGGSALDVLKKVPMVDVDINDNVSLRGSQNVKILVDDKPSKFASLKQIPSDAIEKVEVITNPSAKYESEGVTGIINLVMKKNDNFGFTGNLSLGGGHKDRYWGGLELSLKKSRFLLTGSMWLGKVTGFAFTNDINVNYTNPVSFYRSSGSGLNGNKYLFTQEGIEYELGKGNTIGLDGNYGYGHWDNLNKSSSKNYDASNVLTSANDRVNDFQGIWESYYLSLYYNNKLDDKGRELSGDLSYSGNRNKYNNNLTRHDYDGNNNLITANPYLQFDETNNRMFNLNAQADYVHPFNTDTKLEAGYKGTFRKNDNDFQSDSLDYSSNMHADILSTTNHFKLTDNINAGYVVFSSALAGFNYKLGLRVEHTDSRGELLTGGQNFTKNYTDFFPSVSVSRKFANIHQVQASYSRRITRPNIWRLNPFINRNDPKFIYMGNPDLNPEFTDSYELSYSLFSPAISVTPMFFFRKTHDVISNYTYVVSGDTILTTYKNASGSKSYGMDLVLSSRALAWLNLNGTLSMYNTKFDSDPINDNASEEGFSWKATLRASFTFGKLFNFEVYYNYEGKKINAQGFNVPTNNLDLAISRSFLKDKATLSLRASDVFKTVQWGQDINSNLYNGTYRNKYDSRTVMLSLSYRFGNTDEYYQKKKKVKQNSNEGNDSQDNNMGR